MFNTMQQDLTAKEKICMLCGGNFIFLPGEFTEDPNANNALKPICEECRPVFQIIDRRNA